MFRKPILSLLLVCAVISSAAQSVTAHRNEVTDGYNYWLYTPAANSDSLPESKPLIIFLHGASLCGNNLDRVRRYGTIDAIDMGRDIDAYVIAPQNPGGAWKPSRVWNIVEHICESNPIDTNRIYVLGMSLGGYGALDMAATYPDRIAATIAMCGGATVNNPEGLNTMPLWIIHGTADRAVRISQSDRVVDAMKQVNDSTPRLIYNRVPGMNHGQPARLFYLAEIYNWLLSHSLSDPGRTVNPAFEINDTVLRNAYDGLNTKGRKHSGTRKRRPRGRRR